MKPILISYELMDELDDDRLESCLEVIDSDRRDISKIQRRLHKLETNVHIQFSADEDQGPLSSSN